MRITELSIESEKSFVIKAVAGEPEFRQLKGYTDKVCIFASQTIDMPVRITKTGARHSYAKWLLLPSKLRAMVDTAEYDFSNIKAGFVESMDCVFFIYRADRKGVGEIPSRKNTKLINPES